MLQDFVIALFIASLCGLVFRGLMRLIETRPFKRNHKVRK